MKSSEQIGAMKINEIEVRGEVKKTEVDKIHKYEEEHEERVLSDFYTAFEKTILGRNLLRLGYELIDNEIEDEDEKKFYIRIVYSK